MSGTSLVSAAMSFVACTRRGGAGGLPQLPWWLQVHDHCGPDFSEWAPKDLCWWPCNHSAWGTPGPNDCIPSGGGARGIASSSFCEPVQVTPQDAPHSRQLGEGIPQPKHLSQQELSSSGYLSLQLSNGTEGFYSNNSGAGPAPDMQRQHRAKKRPTKCVKAGLEQKCLQVVRKCKRCWIAKAILRKKIEAGGIGLPDFRLYYRTTVIRSMALNRHNYRSMEQHRKFRNNTQAPVVT